MSHCLNSSDEAISHAVDSRALEVANYPGPRTAPGGLRRFYNRGSETPRNTQSQNEPEQAIEATIEIDYDLLVSNVENMLTADKKLLKKELRPKDLLVKSNPALFGNMHPDITNPRDMYNFLSRRKFPKIADDVSFSGQKSNYEERLQRSSSFKDLNKSSNAKMQKKYHFHSHVDLSLMEKKDPSLAALNSNAPYFGPEDMARLPEREKTMMTNFNLPSLNEVGNETGIADVNEPGNKAVSLPVIQSNDPNKRTQSEQKVKRTKSLGPRSKTNVTFSNKIDKWFSEMPSDVTDKADRAIMADMIRERMTAYQNNYRSDEMISKMKRRHTNLKSLNQIQHQYLELRADTAPKPRRNDLTLSHYKMKQKSSLNLKTDMNDLEKCENPFDLSDKTQNVQNPDENANDENKSARRDIAKSKSHGTNGLKRINLDQFAVDAYNLNPNHRFTFAQLQNVHNNRFIEEIDEESLRRKADKEHWLRMSQAKTHPSIVNIRLDKEKKENSRSSHLRQALSVVKMDANKDDENYNQHAQIQLPNGRDNQSSSSASSSDNIRRKQTSKAALSKFKTLDVFEGTKNVLPDNHILIEAEQYTNPLVKLDLRRARTQHRHSKELENSNTGVLGRKPHEMATVDFQFGQGEVVITRKANGGLVSPELGTLKSPNAPPNNTEYSGITPLNEHSVNTERSKVDHVLLKGDNDPITLETAGLIQAPDCSFSETDEALEQADIPEEKETNNISQQNSVKNQENDNVHQELSAQTER
ncbi:unnamed protein product [Mytilus coruscus]|uniref:Uncharacterized protein n=1 Tax=Mytilus coruscus TaxID=42192 RepID=A0A6J8AID1_MYTCO|nr:unnamed protein product [Mytilus coruscus]